ncbi:MAG: DUF1492 domain-containing protein [Ruminiclostridium sp.]|nr:DUF1492 domain-containing protein [Ruminiclostridium sp.]
MTENRREVRTQKELTRFLSIYNRYRGLCEDIRSTKEQILFLKEITEYKSPSLEGAGSSGGCYDKVGGNVGKIVDLKRALGEKEALMIDLWDQLTSMISSLSNPTERRVMTERYINQKQWDKIAEDTNLCQRWLFKLHKRALQELQ